MNKLIILLSLLAALVSATAAADAPVSDEPVDCFYEANASNPLCRK